MLQKNKKKKCYNEECDWEVIEITLSVCLCVYVAECMRVCIFSSKSSDFFS